MLWLALLPSAACPTPPWPELACRLGRYTPRLVLGADRLLAELEASLRLFGGLPALLERIDAELGDQPVRQAVAATPLAAAWLARTGRMGREAVCPDLASTRLALREVPLAALDLAPGAALRLETFGLRRLGDVLDLPRAGLGARLGAGFLRDLGRALGELADPQPWFAFPERFRQRLELPAAVDTAPALLFAARRLLLALTGWLAARQAALREMTWTIDHGHGAATVVPLAFGSPVRDAARIERVLAERLAALRLPAPARELALAVDRIEARTASPHLLFGRDAGAEGEALADLCDRLAARLGERGVQGLGCVAEHRPERATVAEVGAGGTAGMVWDRPRPLWLVEPPRPLHECRGRPHYRNRSLNLLAGPERIESGWWDGMEIRRDYFIAVDPDWRWLWIFRRQDFPGGWYLHGWFA